MKEFKNVKLIASDMDHTLLTEKGELPLNFDGYIFKLDELGIDFVIASGRPLYTLEEIFSKISKKISFISDNGGVISHRGEVIFKSLLDPLAYQEMIKFVEDSTDGIAILCGLDSAVISNKNKKHEEFLKFFYSKINLIENLSNTSVDANKFTIYFPNKNSKKYFEDIFKPKYGDCFSVTVGDSIWIDIMNYGVDKGKAIKLLGERLGIKPGNMMAFGDTYNDIEMLEAVDYSYIVKNANKEMRKHAKYVTDSNDEFGVTNIIDKVIKTYKTI
ncbi:HAD family hydrolase [Lelliottia amnigena]|uniref:HAD family hydrolase n=1 Tax=Lelliottia amnigena TaxID=61646 RepID=UPI003BA057DE